MWILYAPPPPRRTQGILTEKGVVCQNPHTAIKFAFTVRLPSQKIYISIICNVRMMSERIAVISVPCWSDRLLSYACPSLPRIHFDRCINMVIYSNYSHVNVWLIFYSHVLHMIFTWKSGELWHIITCNIALIKMAKSSLWCKWLL